MKVDRAKRVGFPPPEGPATHDEASLGRVPARVRVKRRQRDDQAAVRKGEAIQPRKYDDRVPTGLGVAQK